MTDDLNSKDQFYEYLNHLHSNLLQDSKISFSQLSKNAGFSSRNYFREVLRGLKMPREDALKRILKVLKASSAESQIARTLHKKVLFPEKFTKKEEIKLSKLKLEAQQIGKQEKQNPNLLYSKGQIPVVLAAIGSETVGSSLELICHRCGFGKETVLSILELLKVKEIVREISGQYYMTNPHMIFDHLGGSEGFHDFFMEGLERTRIQAKKNFQNRNNLFFQSNFTIKKSSLPELRTALRQTLIDFIEEHECETGDSVAHMYLSLFDPKQN